MANVQLLQETLRHIEEHPEQWYQREWRCETGSCFAGHAALLTGAVWAHGVDSLRSTEVITPDGQLEKVREFAMSALGIDDLQADFLFHSDNTLKQLRSMVAGLIEREQESLHV